MKKYNAEFINCNFELPDNQEKLQEIEEEIEKIKYQFKLIQKKRKINDINYTKMCNKLVLILFYLGELSEPAFDIECKLQDLYTLKYAHAPELGKRLFYDHYEKIHYPYSILKNRCFKLLDDLDFEYVKQYNKQPPK